MAEKKSPAKVTVKKKTTVATKKSSKFVNGTLQMPGHPVEELKIAAGTTQGDLLESRNLGDFDVRINNSSVVKGAELTEGFTIRVSVKTKHG